MSIRQLQRCAILDLGSSILKGIFTQVYLFGQIQGRVHENLCKLIDSNSTTAIRTDIAEIAIEPTQEHGFQHENMLQVCSIPID